MDSQKKLQRILVRFFPPGIILEFVDNQGFIENKSIDLLNLSEKYINNNFRSDVEYLVDQIVDREPLTKNKRKEIDKIIHKLIDKITEKKNQEFVHFRTLTCHELPLTNCAFNKSGDK